MQQCLYKCGCKCEHPCLCIAALGCGGDATAIGMLTASALGKLSIQVGYPTALCLGIPSLLITGCALCEAYKRCKANNADQLDYITDSTNWPKHSADHDHGGYDYGYDSGYDS